jgi:putative transposase
MKPSINNALLDELLKDYSQPADLLGPDGLLTELKKRLINRVLDSELTTHLGYDKHQSPPECRSEDPPNARNGHSAKTLRSDDGKLDIKVPRDRNGDFEPTLVPKHQRQFDGFDECIVSLYSRGLGVREIQQHLLEIYKVEVSTALITNATDAVIEEVKAWQNRTLEPVYPIVYFDAIVVKVRHEGKVANRAIYLALAINLEGKKEVLGMWSSENEGARFWLAVATELKNRGLQDIFICCVDGLSGFAQALETVYPKCRVLSSDNYKSPQRQLKLPTPGVYKHGSETFSPPLPWGTGGEKSPWGFRGKQTGSSCLSSAGFGAAAP